MKFLLVLCAVIAFASCESLKDSVLKANWLQFKKTHSKNYANDDEEISRFNIWKSNLNHINKHNQEFSKGVHTFDLAMNRFGDLVILLWSSLLLK